MMVSAVRLAATTVKDSLIWSSLKFDNLTTPSTRLRRTLTRTALRAVESLSRANTFPAPILAKAMARIPDPAPTSRAVIFSCVNELVTSSRNSKQQRVVGCAPVPKAIPGSMVMTFRSDGGYVLSHGGVIHKPFPTFWGEKNLRQELFQFLSFRIVQRIGCSAIPG